MNGRLLILPLSLPMAAVALVGLACNNDKPKPDMTTAPATAATTSTAAAPASGAGTGTGTGMGAAAAQAASGAVPPASGSASAVAAATTAAPAPAGNVTYTPFTQKSHGYSLEVPSVFVAKVDPKNSDGQDWSWGGHANITTIALPAIDSLDDSFTDVTSHRKGITEKTKKDNWYLIKGKDAGKNFIEKSFVTVSTKTDLDITWDDTVAGQIDPLVQHMLDTFKSGK